MILQPAPTPLARFTYLRTHNLLVADASDLLAAREGFGRVWDDAADEGLTIVSPTGRNVVYVLTDRHRDDEGDMLWLDLVPALPRDAALPTVRIFND